MANYIKAFFIPAYDVSLSLQKRFGKITLDHQLNTPTMCSLQFPILYNARLHSQSVIANSTHCHSVSYTMKNEARYQLVFSLHYSARKHAIKSTILFNFAYLS